MGIATGMVVGLFVVAGVLSLVTFTVGYLGARADARFRERWLAECKAMVAADRARLMAE